MSDSASYTQVTGKLDLIDRQLVLDRINKQREHLRPYLYPQDKIGDSAYRICIEFVERIPSAEPEQFKSCKNCIHLGHAYMMPCKNCRRNQMMPDWYEVETERRTDE